MTWRKTEGKKGYTIVFQIHGIKPSLLRTRANDIWKAVQNIIDPSVLVSEIIVRMKDGEVWHEQRVSLLDDEEEMLEALQEECAGMRDDTVKFILDGARIDIGWDRVGKRPVVTVCATAEGYAAMKEVREGMIGPWRMPDFMLEGALKRILGDEIAVRFAEAEIREESEPAEVEAREESQPGDVGLNNCFFKTEKTITHDGLRFRSRAEIAIYDELKSRKVLFFPNAAAVLGGTQLAPREPDFLICNDGKWGILEVNGPCHDTTAVKDHNRGRLFQLHGLLCFQCYDADRCQSDAKGVVDEFLSILAQFKVVPH